MSDKNNYGNFIAGERKRKYDYSTNHTFNNKSSFWMSSLGIKLSTIHSFKGWESLGVILLLPENTEKTELIYTGLTRAIRNLIVINNDQRFYGMADKLPKKWNSIEYETIKVHSDNKLPF